MSVSLASCGNRAAADATAFAWRLPVVDEQPGDVAPGLLRDLLKQVGLRDVDLGERVADHVQADEQRGRARRGPD